MSHHPIISPLRHTLITGDKSYHDITEDICAPSERAPGKAWIIAFIVSATTLGYRTIGWGWDITNFVWWIGIGHAGTLISAILLLFRQKWRTGVNRAAEAMTIFAVMCAGLFPLIHMGRLWLGFFIFPYPNTRGPLWVNFNHWQRFESLSLILAGIATPLVLSVHTIVSFDFATSVIPGWHTTIFPPYFVAGAIFSGFAMVQTLMIITRKVLKLHDYITLQHIESMNKVIVLTGTMVGVAYLTELFISWYEQLEFTFGHM